MFNQKKPGVKERVEQPKKTVKPVAAGRRPQRAAAASTKSYREPDTDDSQSESETPLVPKAKTSLCLMSPFKNTNIFYPLLKHK